MRKFTYYYETKDESKEYNDYIYYYQILLFVNIKVITSENNSSNMFSILNELAFNGESSLNGFR